MKWPATQVRRGGLPNRSAMHIISVPRSGRGQALIGNPEGEIGLLPIRTLMIILSASESIERLPLEGGGARRRVFQVRQRGLRPLSSCTMQNVKCAGLGPASRPAHPDRARHALGFVEAIELLCPWVPHSDTCTHRPGGHSCSYSMDKCSSGCSPGRNNRRGWPGCSDSPCWG